ncbi:peroxidase 64-like [Tripterygium wilfordii]|uniref:peroxidase 64-like n=1 Tax=Tripterygium wilfordii TaxID=458696 RepID=UPI0018F8558D|nr:peroxidase 64-like [Tripterygium wilfordii]
MTGERKCSFFLGYSREQIQWRQGVGHVAQRIRACGRSFCAPFPSFYSLGASLNLNYYKKTCPDEEFIVAEALTNVIMEDKTVAAALLRKHFHECFIRVRRKSSPLKLSIIQSYTYVIDNPKKELGAVCSGVASSIADILALAARNAVGLLWRSSETRQLPSSTFGTSQLQQSFSQRGLSMNDLVGLMQYNPQFQRHKRSRSFNASILCRKLKDSVENASSSDQALLSTPKTKDLVPKFASSQGALSEAFMNSMIKMNSMTGGQELTPAFCDKNLDEDLLFVRDNDHLYKRFAPNHFVLRAVIGNWNPSHLQIKEKKNKPIN